MPTLGSRKPLFYSLSTDSSSDLHLSRTATGRLYATEAIGKLDIVMTPCKLLARPHHYQRLPEQREPE